MAVDPNGYERNKKKWGYSLVSLFGKKVQNWAPSPLSFFIFLSSLSPKDKLKDLEVYKSRGDDNKCAALRELR